MKSDGKLAKTKCIKLLITGGIREEMGRKRSILNSLRNISLTTILVILFTLPSKAHKNLFITV